MAWGPTICFLLNTFTFLPLIVLLFMMHTENRRAELEKMDRKSGTGMLAGYLYAIQTPRIRNMLIVASIAGFLVAPYILLMPVYAKDAVNAGAASLGLLMAIAGVGSVLGALWAAGTNDNRRDMLIAVSVVAGAAGLLGLSLFTALPLALILVFIIGIFDTMTPTLVNTALQVETEDRYLGRVMSLLTLLLLGAPRIGVLILGALAEVTSITVALGASALTCLIVGGAIALLLLKRRNAAAQALAD
ncbi:MAG: MFS transporter [Anaerolineales bacterium]|nr:MFS transporter [Anaerolineales bacterium]